MKSFLLDTSFALFSLAEPERIPAKVRRTVQSGLVYLSVISYWEVLLKSRKGKLEVGDVRVWWSEAVETLAATVLPLRAGTYHGDTRPPANPPGSLRSRTDSPGDGGGTDTGYHRFRDTKVCVEKISHAVALT
jgi:hypothetical protein